MGIKVYGPDDPPNDAHPTGTLKMEYGNSCCGEHWADPNASDPVFADGSETCTVEMWVNPMDAADPMIHPGAQEVCNGIDDDCDDETDEGCGPDDDSAGSSEASGGDDGSASDDSAGSSGSAPTPPPSRSACRTGGSRRSPGSCAPCKVAAGSSSTTGPGRRCRPIRSVRCSRCTPISTRTSCASTGS